MTGRGNSRTRGEGKKPPEEKAGLADGNDGANSTEKVIQQHTLSEDRKQTRGGEASQ